jgi:hypothetical protein
MADDTTIFWHPTGPKLSWDGKTFLIEDLNPEARIEWMMSSQELADIGRRCLELTREMERR